MLENWQKKREKVLDSKEMSLGVFQLVTRCHGIHDRFEERVPQLVEYNYK